ncbi:hypothetical protein CNMCM5793_003104 [Aspergillus hiratsukae]|uniref:HPP transmembrane region domain-containing protein n=1 Tax=Aspergillus hiratsukae TaxID=1194566 RepID=A0A8H6UV93_9EURO|nr:hypothetical protein CNMCM5793_003104 [Aspergillus hiratsukae]KAF7168192.1 hypothetical protein CNMCM6106_003482 [Aspergillus hiratsukae]
MVHQPQHVPPTSKGFDLSRWHFDIDAYLNPYLPAPPWRWLPRPVSHFLGYRGDQPPKAVGNLLITFWALIGAFCGVLVVAEASLHVPSFQAHHAPIIVASFGATAVLEFSAIDSPFAQPRNMIVGQTAASIIGVAIGKLFALNPHAHALPQVGGALACAITVAFMVITNTTHPPAGATALLAVTEAYEVGWYLVPIVLLGCVLILCVALLINNIQRRFPVYWWTPHSLARPKPEDAESVKHEKPSIVKPIVSEDSFTDTPEKIIIQRGEVLMPDNLWISAEEREVLERVSQRIQ